MSKSFQGKKVFPSFYLVMSKGWDQKWKRARKRLTFDVNQKFRVFVPKDNQQTEKFMNNYLSNKWIERVEKVDKCQKIVDKWRDKKWKGKKVFFLVKILVRNFFTFFDSIVHVWLKMKREEKKLITLWFDRSSFSSSFANSLNR